MFRTYLAASAVLLLAACGQGAAPTAEETPAAPQGLHEQVSAMSPEQQPVFAYQQFIAYQQAHPELTPPCTAVRGTERITVPGNVDPASIYAAHQGQSVFTIQCGALISATRMDFNEKWLIAFAPGAAEPTVEHCLGPNATDRCPRQPPTVEIAPTP